MIVVRCHNSFFGTGSIVALESLSLHLPIFPNLWRDLLKTGSESSIEFINLLCTNCNYFRDYINLLLTQEKYQLKDDVIYDFLKQIIPRVRFSLMSVQYTTCT